MMQTFIFAVQDQNNDSRTMVRFASTWMTAWEVVSRRLRNAQIGKSEPVARFWLESEITVYNQEFKVIAKGKKSDLDRKLCQDATGSPDFNFGVRA